MTALMIRTIVVVRFRTRFARNSSNESINAIKLNVHDIDATASLAGHGGPKFTIKSASAVATIALKSQLDALLTSRTKRQKLESAPLAPEEK
jgi:hypothetical protein